MENYTRYPASWLWNMSAAPDDHCRLMESGEGGRGEGNVENYVNSLDQLNKIVERISPEEGTICFPRTVEVNRRKGSSINDTGGAYEPCHGYNCMRSYVRNCPAQLQSQWSAIDESNNWNRSSEGMWGATNVHPNVKTNANVNRCDVGGRKIKDDLTLVKLHARNENERDEKDDEKSDDEKSVKKANENHDETCGVKNEKKLPENKPVVEMMMKKDRKKEDDEDNDDRLSQSPLQQLLEIGKYIDPTSPHQTTTHNEAMMIYDSSLSPVGRGCSVTVDRSSSEYGDAKLSPDDDSKLYTCSQCSYRATKKGQLRKHMSVHGVFLCAHCEFSSENGESLECHRHVKHPGLCGRKLCKKCRVLYQHDELIEHERQCSGEKQRWPCPTCDKEFKFLSVMKAHMRKWHPSLSIDSLAQSDAFPAADSTTEELTIGSDIDLEQTTATTKAAGDAEKCFECEDCDMIFKSKWMLSSHQVVHSSSDAPFFCDMNGCSTTFRSDKELNVHRMSIHGLGPKRYECTHPECTMQFSKYGYYKRHKLTHAVGERRFKCDWPNCGKAFSHTDNLKVHYRRHTDEKPYQCQHCGSAYRQKSGLKYHLEKVHDERSSGKPGRKRKMTNDDEARLDLFVKNRYDGNNIAPGRSCSGLEPYTCMSKNSLMHEMKMKSAIDDERKTDDEKKRKTNEDDKPMENDDDMEDNEDTEPEMMTDGERKSSGKKKMDEKGLGDISLHDEWVFDEVFENEVMSDENALKHQRVFDATSSSDFECLTPKAEPIDFDLLCTTTLAKRLPSPNTKSEKVECEYHQSYVESLPLESYHSVKSSESLKEVASSSGHASLHADLFGENDLSLVQTFDEYHFSKESQEEMMNYTGNIESTATLLGYSILESESLRSATQSISNDGNELRNAMTHYEQTPVDDLWMEEESPVWTSSSSTSMLHASTQNSIASSDVAEHYRQAHSTLLPFSSLRQPSLGNASYVEPPSWQDEAEDEDGREEEVDGEEEEEEEEEAIDEEKQHHDKVENVSVKWCETAFSNSLSTNISSKCPPENYHHQWQSVKAENSSAFQNDGMSSGSTGTTHATMNAITGAWASNNNNYKSPFNASYPFPQHVMEKCFLRRPESFVSSQHDPSVFYHRSQLVASSSSSLSSSFPSTVDSVGPYERYYGGNNYYPVSYQPRPSNIYCHPGTMSPQMWNSRQYGCENRFQGPPSSHHHHLEESSQTSVIYPMMPRYF